MRLITVTSCTLVLGVTLCGYCTYLLYLLCKRTNDKDQRKPVSGANQQISLEDSDSIPKTIDLPIPNEYDFFQFDIVRKINEVQEQTNTKIIYELKNSTEVSYTFIGNNEACLMAEIAIRELAIHNVTRVSEMYIPQACTRQFIGRHSKNLIELRKNTGASILLCGAKIQHRKRVLITGTPKQIKEVKKYIQNVVMNYELGIGKRTTIEVYVSAIEHPSRFWIQIVNTKILELIQLAEDMTNYYNKPENQMLHVLEQCNVGDLVAAPHVDNKWYRAIILKLISNEETPKSEFTYIEISYIDFGGTNIMKCETVFQLHPHYKNLKYRAIECFLANIKPVGSSWSEEAIKKFQELTRTAKLYKIDAKLHGYEKREYRSANGERVVSHTLGIDLLDMKSNRNGAMHMDQSERYTDAQGRVQISIADELVNYGYAVYVRQTNFMIQ